MNSAGYSVTDLAMRWRTGKGKVRAFIKRGELRAVNVASSAGGKPQWAVPPEALAEFEARRSSVPAPKARRRRNPEVVDYFPNLT
jgi:hypothetical protein